MPEHTQRSLYFYELNFSLYKRFEGTEHAYVRCLEHLNQLVQQKDPSRYYKREHDTVFFGQLDLANNRQYARGRLFKVRNDIFPQIINMSNEDISDLEVDEEQGILETTHFILDCRDRNKSFLTLEYNHYGARITEFARYFALLGRQTEVVKKVHFIPIVRDRLTSIARRVNRISKVTVRVHKDNVDRITESDQGLGSALYHAKKYSDFDYVELDLKFNYKERSSTKTIYDKIMDWVRIFITDPTQSENFDMFRIEAEDEEKANALETFDLLVDREKSDISVEKKPKSRVIISNDMFPKMVREYESKFRWLNTESLSE